MKKSYSFKLSNLGKQMVAAKKLLAKKSSLVVALFLMSSFAAMSQTNFYLRTDSLNPTTGALVKPAVTNARAWTTDPLGKGGASIPKNFTADNQIFNIQTNGYTNGNRWAVTGVGSKVVIGVKDSTITFTSNNTSKLVATVDVLANATFNYQGAVTDSITFGTLATGSTVKFPGNTGGISQKVIAANYYNLDLTTGGATSAPLTFPFGGTIGVAGKYTSRGSNVYGSTINFNGNGGQVIPASDYDNIVISGNKTVPDTLRGTINVFGTAAYAATGVQPYTVGNTIAFNGAVAQQVSNLAFNNLAFTNGHAYYVSSFDNAAKTITFFSKHDLSVGQKPLTSPGGNALVLDTASTVTAITNDTVVTLSSAPLLRLFALRAGHALGKIDTVFATSYSAASKSITLAAGYTVAAGDTINGQVIANGVVASVAGSVLTFTANLRNTNFLGNVLFGNADGKPSPKTIIGNIAVTGNFTAGAGSINAKSSTITFLGKRQTIPGIKYENLVVNQDSATTAVLGNNATVTGNFVLQSGKLTTTNTKLLTLDAGANFVPVTNDTFFVNGPLAKNFASTTPFAYTIGVVRNGVSYARSAVVTPTTADAKTFTITYALGKTSNSTKLDTVVIESLDTMSYYNVALSNYTVGTDTSARFSFQYRYDTSITAAGLLLAHYDGTKYVSLGNTLQASSGPSVAFGYIASNATVSTFGRFAFGFAKPGVVPVKFGLVSATAQNNRTNRVNWQSLTELNVAKYIVEVSINHLDFKAIGSVNAIGTKQYSYTDITPRAGVNYYRVTAVDFNGNRVYSSIVSANQNTQVEKVSVYPNPVINKQVNIAINNVAADLTVTVTNAIGQTVLSKNIAHNGGTTTYSIALPATTNAGTYFVKMTDGASQIIKTVIVK